MKTGLRLFAAFVVLAVVCEARLAEKVSEDDDFVVYRIPVKALDLQSQATDQFQGYELSPAYGRSASKSSSHSKSSSSSTGSGKGRGYGQGGSSQGHGQGYGGSSSGHGYGGSSGGYGGSSGGYGGSSGGYGGSSGGHSGEYSSGTGTGYGGSGHGGSGSGYGGSGSGYGGHYRGGYSPGYSPSYNGGSSPSYEDEEDGGPKIVTTTKTVTTGSAQDTGIEKVREHRQPSDSLGEIKFKLGDYLKGKYFQGASSEFSPGYRSGQGFNVNEFTRSLNQGMTSNPSYRNNRFLPQASIVIPQAYAFRHAGFGFPGY